MEQPAKAILLVEGYQCKPEQRIKVQYNPTEISYEKSVQLAEIAIPGLDAPLQQFVRGQAEKLNLELYFDTTEYGMGSGATSVTTLTDQIYQLTKIEPTRRAPPICTFIWSDKFPGSSIGAAAGTAASAAGAAAGNAVAGSGAGLGNQRRNGFRCVVESIKQKFTLFSPEGIPLRATLTVTLREYKTLDEQLQQLNLSSPDRTQSHVVQRGETLSAIAACNYDSSGAWRSIAAENGIEDPRRIVTGLFLRIPPIR